MTALSYLIMGTSPFYQKNVPNRCWWCSLWSFVASSCLCCGVYLSLFVCVFLQVVLCVCSLRCSLLLCVPLSAYVCVSVCVALPWRTLLCHCDQKAIIGVLPLWGGPPTLVSSFWVRERERGDAREIGKHSHRKREETDEERETEQELQRHRGGESQVDIAASVWELSRATVAVPCHRALKDPHSQLHQYIVDTYMHGHAHKHKLQHYSHTLPTLADQTSAGCVIWMIMQL